MRFPPLSTLVLMCLFSFGLLGLLPAQTWGVEFGTGWERRALPGFPDPMDYNIRALTLTQVDFAPGVWWSLRPNRFGRARLHHGMLRGDAATFGLESTLQYRDANMRNTTLVGAAAGGGWKGSWRAFDWRIGFEGGYARTSGTLLLVSADPTEGAYTGYTEVLNATIAEVSSAFFTNFAYRIGPQFQLGLEQRVAARWTMVSGDVENDIRDYDGWGSTTFFGPQQLALPRLWMSMAF
jgi:hypothetical protein